MRAARVVVTVVGRVVVTVVVRVVVVGRRRRRGWWGGGGEGGGEGGGGEGGGEEGWREWVMVVARVVVVRAAVAKGVVRAAARGGGAGAGGEGGGEGGVRAVGETGVVRVGVVKVGVRAAAVRVAVRVGVVKVGVRAVGGDGGGMVSARAMVRGTTHTRARDPLRAGAVVPICANGDARAIRAQRDARARPVACGLAVNVLAELHPRGGRLPLVHTHMTRTRAGAVVGICANSDARAIRAQRDAPARIVACGLAVNVLAELRPRS